MPAAVCGGAGGGVEIVSFDEATTILALPETTAGQTLVLMQRENSSTVPSLVAGFTNVLTISNVPASRSMRVSYRVGAAVAENVSAFSVSYALLGNASTVGVSATVNGGSTDTSPTIPALTGITADRQSAVLYFSYAPGLITGVNPPYSFATGSGGGYVDNVVTTNLSASTAIASSSVFDIGCVVEMRP